MTSNQFNMYQEVLNHQTDYIPLLVKVANHSYTPHNCIDCMNDPEKVIENYRLSHQNMMGLTSDYIPFMESNFLENLIPSFFGAKTHIAPGGHVDVIPPFSSVLEVGDLQQYTLGGEILKQAMSHLAYLEHHKPDGVAVEITRFMSPLDYAVILCGGNFYMELLLYPEEAMAFMNRIVDLTLETYTLMKEAINQPINQCITIRGMYFNGIRLTSDAIVNLSPDQIRQYLIPLYKRFKTLAGQVMLHYCCTPAPSGHVIGALTQCETISSVDNWQGYPTFFTNNEADTLQDKVNICTDIPYQEACQIDSLMNQPFFKEVPRLKGRALTITVEAPSIQAGETLYQEWQKYFNR